MKKTFTKALLIAGLFLSSSFTLSGCGGADTATPIYSNFNGVAAVSDTVNVIYTVSGTATKAMLTYRDATNTTKQETVSLPWSFALTAKKDAFLYISAQNDTNIGSVTSEIRVNGSVFKTETKSTAYGIATATGSCC